MSPSDSNPPASPQPAPCGSWSSPITPDVIVGESTPIDEIAIDGGRIFWTERRPRERGRTTLMRLDGNGAVAELTPAPFNARSRVHEYGGGALCVAGNEIVCVSFDDQQLYRVRGDGAAPVVLTHAPEMRHADAIRDASRNRLIAVREDHSVAGREAVNTLVAIDLASGDERVLASGHDFFSSPALSPDGRTLAWLSWDHPNMPWDGSDLWHAAFDSAGNLEPARRVAGGRSESIFQPSWSPQGELHFVSDASGWWNLYRHRDGRNEPLHPMDAEFGMPQWAFGIRTYGFDARGDILCAYTANGEWHLARLRSDGDGSSGSSGLEPLRTSLTQIRRVAVDGDTVLLLGGARDAPERIVRIDLATGEERVVRASSTAHVDPAYVSVARPIAFETTGGLTSHAFHYAPVNPAFRPRDGERPPLLVLSHGGPTGTASAAFNWTIQFWTSRGFAVVDVNYGGSSGYGRAYRERLAGQWGVVDVDDAVNAARHLVARGEADGERVAIRGGSAGGYTTLCALTFRDYFKAGASHFGIGDLELLVSDTHKFESRYLDSLIGPYPAEKKLYRERSPIHHTDRLSSAMILFQGSEDKAVPPNQAETMYAAVRAKKLPVALLMFEGEGHGFRRAENIQRTLEAELYFYGRVFGFTPADTIEPVAIDNL